MTSKEPSWPLRVAWRAFVREFPPRFVTLAVFAGGVVLLVAGATPSDAARMSMLKEFVPLPLVELSHFAGSLAGAVLLVLAWGLARRLNAAYWLTLSFLTLGAAVSLLKSFDYEEAAVLIVIACCLIPTRRFYYRPSSLLTERLSPSWIAFITLAVFSALAIGWVSYSQVNYTDELWWRFEITSDASRFLRASLGIALFTLLFSITRLLRPAPTRFSPPAAEDVERARRILTASAHSSANLALLGDKTFLFHQEREAFLMYRVEGRSWIALGDPVGDRSAQQDLLRDFRLLADRFGGWTVFSEIGKDELPSYLDLGLTLLKIGEEARVPLAQWDEKHPVHRELARARKRLEEGGSTFEWLAPGGSRQCEAELKRVSDAWLFQKKTREKSFSLGSFRSDYLANFPILVVRTGGRISAFTSVWQSGEKTECAADLMRYSRDDAPKGVMDAMFFELLDRAKADGFGWFNLGMAPLSGLQDWEMAPLWHRFGSFVYRFGEDFYNFQGLRQFKEKFRPVWEPRYLASPGGAVLPLVLKDLAELSSGGLKGILSK